MADACCGVLTPQEIRIASQAREKDSEGRRRVYRILDTFQDTVPHACTERARLLTESFRETEGRPLIWRWARAMMHVAENISLFIGEDELVVGRANGSPGRYGLIYPELEGGFLEEVVELVRSGKARYSFTEEDERVIREVILPYWKGKSFHEGLHAALPEETRRLLFNPGNLFVQRNILTETATFRSCLQWILDYEKVLRKGLSGVRDEARERLSALDMLDPQNSVEKAPFYEAVILVCDAAVVFARRYAALAAKMAEETPSAQRRQELLEIAETCSRVPEHPARTFREAVQSQWMTQVFSRLEQKTGAVIGNGRMDQYFYPYFRKDREEGRITDESALELLECVWLNMAQFIDLQVSPTFMSFTEGYAHWEALTIGGRTRDGEDATNDLSYLLLRSKREFPLNYPDLVARVHSLSPNRFLHEICETVKEGSGFPKMLNDEEIVPLLIAKGAGLQDANDYAGSGCTEVRMPNVDTYTSPCAWVNLGAVLEMALNDGRIRKYGEEQFGPRTGDPRSFETYDDLWRAFCAQQEYILKHVFIQQYVVDTLRPKYLATPLSSALHDQCMNECKDLHCGNIDGGVKLGYYDIIGFGTVIDSLAAVRKLVFEEKRFTMAELMDALDCNFEGREAIRHLCLNTPRYGNGDSYADGIGRDVESISAKFSSTYRTAFGGELDVRYVPLTSHIPLGKLVGATPNGRKAGEYLSEGASASHGADVKGPTGVLLSNARTKSTGYKERAARLLNIKLSPGTVAGWEGTEKLVSLIRAFEDLKLWHLQFNVVNRETLLAAQNDPGKYRNLLVRVAGYSAYFVDLSPELQNEIIARTEHSF